MLVREYLKYNYEAAKEKTDNVLRLLKYRPLTPLEK